MISNNIKFQVYLTLLIPSILCTIFVLYHLLFNKTLRKHLNNHVIIVLLFIGLICEVTNYPWMLYYYHQYQGIWERSWIFCTIWVFLDWSMYLTQTIIFAWATFERHILIFHNKLVSTRFRRIYFHYLPPSVLLLYCSIFYIVVYFFPPCENSYENSFVTCIDPCYLYIYELFMWETIVHQLIPILSIVFFSITLLVRVVRQKCRLHQSIHWRAQRKIAIQVLSISILYLVFSFPYVIIVILLISGYVDIVVSDFAQCVAFSSYFIILLFPFVCALSLPDVGTKLKAVFCLRLRNSRVHPAVLRIR